MKNTHVLNMWTDEPPGPMYFAVPFDATVRLIHRYMVCYADGLPKHWHWNITRIYTIQDVQGYVDDFVSIREANNLDI